MPEKGYNRHHILPSSRDGTFHPKNLIKLPIGKHSALHQLFGNKTPPEQFQSLLNIASTALTEEVKSDLIQILSITEMAYWYKKGIYNK